MSAMTVGLGSGDCPRRGQVLSSRGGLRDTLPAQAVPEMDNSGGLTCLSLSILPCAAPRGRCVPEVGSFLPHRQENWGRGGPQTLPVASLHKRRKPGLYSWGVLLPAWLFPIQYTKTRAVPGHLRKLAQMGREPLSLGIRGQSKAREIKR